MYELKAGTSILSAVVTSSNADPQELMVPRLGEDENKNISEIHRNEQYYQSVISTFIPHKLGIKSVYNINTVHIIIVFMK